jgi:hypothetical protein
MRVKILFNKKENALIQMSDGTQAQLGKAQLNFPGKEYLQLPSKNIGSNREQYVGSDVHLRMMLKG